MKPASLLALVSASLHGTAFAPSTRLFEHRAGPRHLACSRPTLSALRTRTPGLLSARARPPVWPRPLMQGWGFCRGSHGQKRLGGAGTPPAGHPAAPPGHAGGAGTTVSTAPGLHPERRQEGRRSALSTGRGRARGAGAAVRRAGGRAAAACPPLQEKRFITKFYKQARAPPLIQTRVEGASWRTLIIRVKSPPPADPPCLQ